MDALIFDFDGVIVDSEPVHLAGFRQVLASANVLIADEEYYDRYLGYDDHDCFQAVGRDKNMPFTEEQIAQMTEVKTQLVQQTYASKVDALPGAVELIRSAWEADIPLAICSGALRAEVLQAAESLGVLSMFRIIVAARDVQRGKPDPEGYLQAAEKLSAACSRVLSPAACVVVEDSPAGIQSAKGAGMKVLGVTNSYPADALSLADRVVDSLADVSVDSLRKLLQQA